MWLAGSLGAVGTLLLILAAGTIVRGDIFSSASDPSSPETNALTSKQLEASLNKLEMIGQFLLLAGIAIGFASFAGVLFALGITLARISQTGVLNAGPLNPLVRKLFGNAPRRARPPEQRAGLLSAFLLRGRRGETSPRFSVTWALWRGPKPVGGQLVVLGVALTTLWVYVFIPRLSLGTAQGLLINLAAGMIVVVRIGAKNRIFSDLKSFRKSFRKEF